MGAYLEVRAQLLKSEYVCSRIEALWLPSRKHPPLQSGLRFARLICAVAL